MEEERRNLKISGVGSSGGGIYNDVEINGAGSVNGDVECILMSINGTSEVKGNVKARRVKTNGASQIKGTVSAEEVEVNGTLNINGNTDTAKIRVNGTCDIIGSLHASEVEVRGVIKADMDCEAEMFKISGGFKIGGLLNADTIEITVYGGCSAREIGGGKVQVRRPDNIVFQLQKFIKDIFNVKEYLKADTIEGDDVYLEATSARVVRGKNVTIGSDCTIDLVEYKEQIQIVNGASVREHKKV